LEHIWALLNDEKDYEHLLALASERSQESREAVFRTISDLLLAPEALPSEHSRTLAGDILRRLLKEIEKKMRWELAGRLAHRDDVPKDLVNDLAVDDIEIAYPVLAKSPLLTDFDLIEIIHNKAEAHQLAIARRESLSAEVSQALLDSDDNEVIKTLIGNAGAQLTHEMLEFLVEESKWQHAYQEPLVRREDLPAKLARRLYWWVAAPLRAYLVDNFDIDPEVIDDEIEQSVNQELSELARRRAAPTKTQALVLKLQEQGGLDASFLLSALYHGETGLFEEGLIALTQLRPQLTRRLIHDPAGEGLAVVCRALSVDDETYVSIVSLTRHDGYAAREPSAEDKERIREMYRSISPKAARKVMRQWQRDQDYLAALRSVSESDETKSIPTPPKPQL
jgi:uncharacterized protein (DUF2336 family)